MAYIDLLNSTYLDLTSYRGNGSLPAGGTPTSMTFNVALVLDRANDPSALLAADWGSRQQQLEALDHNTLWSTYGADPTKYADALNALSALGISTVDQISPVNGYVSSAESRTIWVQVDENSFKTLFGPGAELLEASVAGSTLKYWEGGLKMHDTLAAAGVRGIMFDGVLATPVLADPGSGTAVTLPQGAQSPGNSIPQVSGLNPNEVSAFYNFPFNSATTPDQWLGVQTGTIGLLEPNMGTQVLLGSQSFQELADAYRATVGVEAPGVYIDVAPGGAIVTSSGERSLDVGYCRCGQPNIADRFLCRVRCVRRRPRRRIHRLSSRILGYGEQPGGGQFIVAGLRAFRSGLTLRLRLQPALRRCRPAQCHHDQRRRRRRLR